MDLNRGQLIGNVPIPVRTCHATISRYAPPYPTVCCDIGYPMIAFDLTIPPPSFGLVAPAKQALREDESVVLSQGYHK